MLGIKKIFVMLGLGLLLLIIGINNSESIGKNITWNVKVENKSDQKVVLKTIGANNQIEVASEADHSIKYKELMDGNKKSQKYMINDSAILVLETLSDLDLHQICVMEPSEIWAQCNTAMINDEGAVSFKLTIDSLDEDGKVGFTSFTLSE